MAKPISARSSHKVGDTHDHRELTASDIEQSDGSFKRGLDIAIQSSIGLPMEQGDFKMLLVHLGKIVTELEQIKYHLQIVTGEEGDIEL